MPPVPPMVTTMASMIGVLRVVGVTTEVVTVRATMSSHLGGQLANAVAGATSAVAAHHVAWADSWATYDAWDAMYDWGVAAFQMSPAPPDRSLIMRGDYVHRICDEPELAVLVVGYRNTPSDPRGSTNRFADDAASHNIIAARLVTLTTAVTLEEWAAARADALTLVGQLAQQATESPHDATSVHTSSTLRPAL